MFKIMNSVQMGCKDIKLWEFVASVQFLYISYTIINAFNNKKWLQNLKTKQDDKK